MLNEIRTACIERGLTGIPAALTQYDLATGMAAWASTVRARIEAAVSSYIWVDSYTAYDSFSAYLLTTGATGSDNYWTGQKNIFELAFGDSIADWRHEGTSPLLADELNDIYLVLNKMIVKQFTTTPSTTTPQTKSGSGATAAAALSACDAAAWSDSAPSYDEHTHSVSMAKPFNYLATMTRNYPHLEVSSPALALNKYLSMRGTWQGISRSLAFEVRAGTAAAPANWTAATSWGDSLGSCSISSGYPYGHMLFLRDTSTERFVRVSPAYTAVGSGLSAANDVETVNTSVFAYAEMDYEKRP